MFLLKYDFASCKEDLLNQANAISQFLCEQIGESTSDLHLGNQATYGLVIILELQKKLIDAARDNHQDQNCENPDSPT